MRVNREKSLPNSKPLKSSDKSDSFKFDQQDPLQELERVIANSYASNNPSEAPASQRDRSSSKTSRVESQAEFFISAEALERPEVQEYMKLYQREHQSAK